MLMHWHATAIGVAGVVLPRKIGKKHSKKTLGTILK
jgi:hypothetical protein